MGSGAVARENETMGWDRRAAAHKTAGRRFAGALAALCFPQCRPHPQPLLHLTPTQSGGRVYPHSGVGGSSLPPLPPCLPFPPSLPPPSLPPSLPHPPSVVGVSTT